MDEICSHHAMKPWLKPLFVGICRGIDSFQGFLAVAQGMMEPPQKKSIQLGGFLSGDKTLGSFHRRCSTCRPATSWSPPRACPPASPRAQAGMRGTKWERQSVSKEHRKESRHFRGPPKQKTHGAFWFLAFGGCTIISGLLKGDPSLLWLVQVPCPVIFWSRDWPSILNSLAILRGVSKLLKAKSVVSLPSVRLATSRRGAMPPTVQFWSNICFLGGQSHKVNQPTPTSQVTCMKCAPVQV